MGLDWEQAVIDSEDPVALGRWWLEALRWVVVNDDPEEFEIRLRADQIPGLIFAPFAEAKQRKNRLHLDFRPDDQDADLSSLSLRLGGDLHALRGAVSSIMWTMIHRAFTGPLPNEGTAATVASVWHSSRVRRLRAQATE